MVSKNPTKAARRKALIRCSNTIRNYIVAADSGVVKGYYTQGEFGKLYKMMEDLEKIAKKMR
tara:strand:- start:450 stop:635 length:186 start_codon:yes stop_codon:yes gene_type:complete